MKGFENSEPDVFWSFCVLWGHIGVGKALPYQQGGDGTNITSVKQSDHHGNLDNGQTKSFKPTPYYECFGMDMCETGVHFCSERRKACEKCSDYQAACGTNFQSLNCTQYCMKFLMEGKCNETATTKPTFTITEKAFDYRQTRNSLALTDNPETSFPWKWICVILIIALAASLSCNVYQHCYGKQSKQTERTKEEQTELLLKDTLTDLPADTPRSLEFISIGNQCTSVCPKEDESVRRSVMPSAPFIPKENLHQNETSVKLHHKHLTRQETEIEEPGQGRERQAGFQGTINELQGPEMDTDKQSSATSSRNSSGATNNTTINININSGQTGLSTASTETKKKAIQNPRKEVHYGVEETDTDFNHGKLVSDENTTGELALLETSVDIHDLKNASHINDLKKVSQNG